MYAPAGTVSASVEAASSLNAGAAGMVGEFDRGVAEMLEQVNGGASAIDPKITFDPLNFAETFTSTANSFMVGGGDGFAVLESGSNIEHTAESELEPLLACVGGLPDPFTYTADRRIAKGWRGRASADQTGQGQGVLLWARSAAAQQHLAGAVGVALGAGEFPAAELGVQREADRRCDPAHVGWDPQRRVLPVGISIHR